MLNEKFDEYTWRFERQATTRFARSILFQLERQRGRETQGRTILGLLFQRVVQMDPIPIRS